MDVSRYDKKNKSFSIVLGDLVVNGFCVFFPSKFINSNPVFQTETAQLCRGNRRIVVLLKVQEGAECRSEFYPKRGCIFKAFPIE
ncbi:MAG: hypothetical protein A2X25_11345 [Chloroflexi bacterium GWB2_49_20]|nr:MAG: hypothetical protein A2X25_11345 [Chloroflexi bacterium GWB2_49_20]OGN86383.1 MAG: hypothetical protein A2X27_05770 [Chloroflexi bacterium GWD2_49_16]HBG74619.1 hypothetical protein [Anaerolineae bacterium]